MSTAIYGALLGIQTDIHAVGIDKCRKNKEQGFNFRGIDDALYAFAPLLTKWRVLLSPRYDGITTSKRATKSGSATYNVKLHGTFTFTHADDGSQHTVGPVYGEANDGQDKAVSKAESIAMRQMFFITFCVPHEPVIGGDPDGIGEDGPPERRPTSAAAAASVQQTIPPDSPERDAAIKEAEDVASLGVEPLRAMWVGWPKERRQMVGDKLPHFQAIAASADAQTVAEGSANE